jgi:hypothetical protein
MPPYFSTLSSWRLERLKEKLDAADGEDTLLVGYDLSSAVQIYNNAVKSGADPSMVFTAPHLKVLEDSREALDCFAVYAEASLAGLAKSAGLTAEEAAGMSMQDLLDGIAVKNGFANHAEACLETQLAGRAKSAGVTAEEAAQMSMQDLMDLRKRSPVQKKSATYLYNSLYLQFPADPRRPDLLLTADLIIMHQQQLIDDAAAAVEGPA